MYLVGLVTQAAVLGAVVAASLAFEDTIRDRLSLPQAGDARVEARLSALDARVDALAEALAEDGTVAGALAGQVETLAGSLATADEVASLERRLLVLERLVARIESKVDDVRDAQLFPVQQGGEETEPQPE